MSNRGFFALLFAGVIASGANPAVGQEHTHKHASARGWSVGAHAVPLITRVAPAMDGRSLTEAYLTQPAVMGHAALWGGRLELQSMLNLEGLTLRRGELNPGIWGEGYIDRRHPHTYLHEVMATVRLAQSRMAAASVSFGKGFAPFGTDDPMARPFVKYPANHHLAQILERLVGIAAVRAGPVLVEGAVFNGDEPRGPEHFADFGRFGDSWSVRATLAPRAGMEVQASYADVASPEFPAGSGFDHRKWSASTRLESSGHDGDRRYVLLEWARTDELVGPGRSFRFESLLAEAAAGRGGVEAGIRYERTLRPEEERLEDPFRTPNPHADVHLLGITRWNIVSAFAAAPPVRVPVVRARPFVEVSRALVRETLGSRVFDPSQLYGSDRLWSLSLGLRVEAGELHPRMGRYGAALPVAASHSGNH